MGLSIPVEIWFARIQLQVIAREIFTSVKDLARKLMRYIQAYCASAKPSLEVQCDGPLVS